MFFAPYIQKPPGLGRRRQSRNIPNIFVVGIDNLQDMTGENRSLVSALYTYTAHKERQLAR